MRRFLNQRWFRRFRRNRGSMFAMWFLILLGIVVTVGPILSPYEESAQTLEMQELPPSRSHWFGYDGLGRDLLTRVLFGGRISLAVGLMGAAISLLIGVTVGGIAGLLGGRVEIIVMRTIDFLYGIPLLLIVISLMVVFGQGLSNIFIALGLVYWLNMARVVRARVAELRSQEYVDAARALGASRRSILVKHILPNTTGVIVVTATFMVPQAIFAESFLSFLGLGVTLPHASWGTLAEEGRVYMAAHPHILAFPATAICLTMLAFQAVGEGLRTAIDPRESEHD